MASHQKKESEGIALLSIYVDEDDDMEDVEEDEERPNILQEQLQEHREELELRTQDSVVTEKSLNLNIEQNIEVIVSESPGNRNTPSFVLRESLQQEVSIENSTPGRVVNFGGSASTATTPQHSFTSPQQQLQLLEQRTRKARLAIVDYGHDEVAMSPEAEEGEIMARYPQEEELPVISGDLREKPMNVLSPSNQATPLLQSEQNSQGNAVDNVVNELGSAEPNEVLMVPSGDQEDIDPLDKFLPPPPKEKCSYELQERIIKFLALKKAGRIYNAEVRNRKEYRNPDFLLHAVTYQDIDQIGSCFSKDVFDPHGYDKSDFYDEIEADMRREILRKDEERKRSQKVDFISGGTQPGSVVPTSKINMQIPGIPVPGSGLTTISGTSDIAVRDGRHNKKSKWDKVDGDRKNLLPPVQDSVSSLAAHAAALSAANAGTGYSAFAQQRRREAEDKRSNDKRVERRS